MEDELYIGAFLDSQPLSFDINPEVQARNLARIIDNFLSDKISLETAGFVTSQMFYQALNATHSRFIDNGHIQLLNNINMIRWMMGLNPLCTKEIGGGNYAPVNLSG